MAGARVTGRVRGRGVVRVGVRVRVRVGAGVGVMVRVRVSSGADVLGETRFAGWRTGESHGICQPRFGHKEGPHGFTR